VSPSHCFLQIAWSFSKRQPHGRVSTPLIVHLRDTWWTHSHKLFFILLPWKKGEEKGTQTRTKLWSETTWRFCREHCPWDPLLHAGPVVSTVTVFFNSSFLTFFSRSFVVTDTIPMSWSSKFLECSFFFTIAIHSSSSNPCFLLYNGQMLQFGQLGRLSLLTISKRLIQKIQIYNLLKIIKKNLFLLDLSTFNSFFFRGCGIIWNRF